jgi:hypothetical protein
MINHLTGALEDWPEVLRGININPHMENLLMIYDDEDHELLPGEMVFQFH